MYLYFAAKIRKSIHIMAYQCIKKQKVGEKEFIIYEKRSFNIYEKRSFNINEKRSFNINEKRGRFTSTSFLQSN